MNTITIEVEIVSEVCPACGVVFGLSKKHRETLLDNGETFYCPNGHGQHFTQRKKLEDEITTLKARLASSTEQVGWWKGEAENTARSLSATRGQVTKLKKRIANGVCPCCHRQFINLHRHMETQHPDFELTGRTER